MSSKVLIKTNDDDWIQIFYDGDLLWENHRPPEHAWQLEELLNTIAPELIVEVESVDSFD